MITDKYLDAIDEAQALLKELLNDPEHGKVVFKGMYDLGDLVIEGPIDLATRLKPGAVLAIGCCEWMLLTEPEFGKQKWQKFRGDQQATSEELYLQALRTTQPLRLCHVGL